MNSRYDHLNREELLRLLQARDQRDATRFGLIWEANEIERDKALNSDFVALDLVPTQSVGAAPWRNLIIEGDNYDALRYLRITRLVAHFDVKLKVIAIYFQPQIRLFAVVEDFKNLSWS
jgi:hypothetical protein